MPRTLPWQKGGSSASVIARPKNSSTKTTKPEKRLREDSVSEGSAEERGTPGKQRTQARLNSKSPSLEPPVERFMVEGIDHDDKYRMVEDEFLTVAQKWTVHLHAAEYKRQQKMVKSRNAETIDAISRPVTDRMPNQTRHRVEGLAKAKAQKAAVAELLSKKAGPEDSDTEEDDTYYGDGLHNLMVTPGKKAASLSKIGSAKATTRAAAGFQKPAPTRAPFTQRAPASSPLSKTTLLQSRVHVKSDPSTASEDDDDDLDAPIKAPKLKPLEGNNINTATSLSTHRSIASSTSSKSFGSKQQPPLTQSNMAAAELKMSRPNFTESEPTRTISNGSWRTRKLVKALQAKAADEIEERKKKTLDTIPTFM